MYLQILILLLGSLHHLHAAVPQFDPTTLMKLVLVPADATVGSVIYRLRASDADYDYPLVFELLDEGTKATIKLETLMCSRYNSVCQANVILQRRLEVGRYYDFRVRVRDTRGSSNMISCSITATNATTPKDVIFPHVPDLVMVPEDAKRGTELGYIIARKNLLYPKPVYLELMGSPLFAIRQRITSSETTEGTVFLLGSLDFETQAVHHLQIYANDPYADPKYDTRNIAGFQLIVVVEDVQDQPPVFTLAPPVTKLDNNLVPGDLVLRVHAEDGDKGNPRPIQYGLVSEESPFTPFFNISPKTGEMYLVRTLDEITAISHPGVPIILTVIAEEIKIHRDEPPAMSSTVKIALVLEDRGNKPPYFDSDYYTAKIDENAPQGTPLIFTDAQVNDDDMGKNGVFSLTLDNNNGTFEISPTVGERRVQFTVKVRDNTLLDYEKRKWVQFEITAQELAPKVGGTNDSLLIATVNATVYINDVNDNFPVFGQLEYVMELPENATAGTRITQVFAEDADSGAFGKVRYTQILGNLNGSLNLDPMSGVITLNTDNHGFDRETQKEYYLYVEARDDEGSGNAVTVPLVVKLLDVNDEIPTFERPVYEFILMLDLASFTSPAIVHAVDRDAEYPNNEVRYEIVSGNYDDNFHIDEVTGELTLTKAIVRSRREVRRVKRDGQVEIYVLRVRAYDLGLPHLSSVCEVHIYPPESHARTMMFIVAGSNPNIKKIEDFLGSLTGGRVTVQQIKPYKGVEVGVTDTTQGSDPKEKSVVVANVLYSSDSVIDLSSIQKKLNSQNFSTVVKHDTVTNEVAGSDNLLFWLLLLLAFLILMLLILLLCCMCEGCPFYVPLKRLFYTHSFSENVHLVHKEQSLAENKGVQVKEWNNNGLTRGKEAWSADNAINVDGISKPTRWQFNKRNQAQDMYDKSNSMKEFRMNRVNDDDDKSTLRISDQRLRSWEHHRKSAQRLKRDYDVEDGDFEDDVSLNQKDFEHSEDEHHRPRNPIHRQHAVFHHNQEITTNLDEDEARDQVFIKEGNTEILRLVTREGKLDERPLTFVPGTNQGQYVLVNNGREIMMQKVVGENQHPNHHGSYTEIPAIGMQTEHLQIPMNTPVRNRSPGVGIMAVNGNNTQQQELLEASLRQQNELLRQILLEKEEQKRQGVGSERSDLRFETQSLPPSHMMLPATTQTDVNIGTQTDLRYLLPERRRTRSDNDDSFTESEDDKYKIYIVGNEQEKESYLKRKKRRRNRTSDRDEKLIKVLRLIEEVKRKIRTPILEESDKEDVEEVEEAKNGGKILKNQVKSGKFKEDQNNKQKTRTSLITDEVLKEISESLNDHLHPLIKQRLNNMECRNGKNRSNLSKNNSLNDLTQYQQQYTNEAFSDDSLERDRHRRSSRSSIKTEVSERSVMENKLKTVKKVDKEEVDGKDVKKKGTVPRYMQWYEAQKDKSTKCSKKVDEVKVTKVLKDKTVRKPKLRDEKKDELPKLRPLLQHSEHRYEHRYPFQSPGKFGQPTQIPAHLYGSPDGKLPQIAKNAVMKVQNQQSYEDTTLPSLYVNNGQILNVESLGGKGFEDGQGEDFDSGILTSFVSDSSLRKFPITEKKSVFTIAYDDVQTKKLNGTSSDSPSNHT